MPVHTTDTIRLYSVILFAVVTLTLEGCGLHRTVLLEMERHERLAPQKQREKALAAIMQKEQEALAAQKPLKEGERVPHMYGQALLQGTWTGTACHERVIIEIELATAEHEASFSRYVEPAEVVGIFRGVDQSTQSQPYVIETGLKGAFNYQDGILSLEATPRPIIPTKEELEEEYRVRDNVAVDIKIALQELQYGSRGPWGIDNVEQVERNRKVREDLEMREGLRRKAMAEEYAAKVDVAKAELVPFQFNMTRDSEGKGWAGTIDGLYFKRCDMRLASGQGITTDKLSPIAGQIALERARNKN